MRGRETKRDAGSSDAGSGPHRGTCSPPRRDAEQPPEWLPPWSTPCPVEQAIAMLRDVPEGVVVQAVVMPDGDWWQRGWWSTERPTAFRGVPIECGDRVSVVLAGDAVRGSRSCAREGDETTEQ